MPRIAVIITCLILSAGAQAQSTTEEAHNTGWALHIDNDLFVGSDTDRDYTGGIAVTLSGRRATEYFFSLEPARNVVDNWFRFKRLYANTPHFQLHAFEAGFALFTPIDLTVPEPLSRDHPYASLFFLVNSETTVVPSRKISFVSVFTLGLLGLDLAEGVQSSIHKLTGSAEPRGWDNQISSGGELTFKYTAGLQKTLVQQDWSTNRQLEVNVAGEGNLGFTTDLAAGLNLRFGRLTTPWWAFNPHQAEYVNLGSPVTARDRGSDKGEFYLYLGATVKLRIYNAILQGQFRDSRVEYDRSELEDFVVELWTGVSIATVNGWKLGAFLRSRSAEIDVNKERRPIWGGFLISRAN